MTKELTPRQIKARWAELGITDPAMIFRLLRLGIDDMLYGEYFDVGITNVNDVVKLHRTKISPKAVSQYQAEAPVGVADIVSLSVARVVPSALKGLLEQFPGTTVEQAIAMKKGGIGKSMLKLLVKLGVTDPEQMHAISKKFAATEVKEWISRGAEAQDFFDAEGNLTVPSVKGVSLRHLGREELSELCITPSMLMSEVRSLIEYFDAVLPLVNSRDEAFRIANTWCSRFSASADPESAIILDAHGFRPSDVSRLMQLEALLGMPLAEIVPVIASSPGLRKVVFSGRSLDAVLADPDNLPGWRKDLPALDLVPRLRADFAGTAAWMADLATATVANPGDSSHFSTSRLYSGLTQCEAIEWQLGVVKTIPEGVSHSGLMDRWEQYYYHSVFSKTNSQSRDASAKCRAELAERIKSGVEPYDYLAMMAIGVPSGEMLDILRQSETITFGGSKPKIVDDETSPQRPDFDWDD